MHKLNTLFIMFQYNNKITTTAKNYNINERDVLFCHLIASGIPRAEAFHALYQRGSQRTITTSTTDNEAAQFIADNPGIKILISKLKNRQPVNQANTLQEVRQAIQEDNETEEEKKRREELTTRQGLIKTLTKEIQIVHGKDSINGLISLAKLQGFDKEDTRQEDERRFFVLPSVGKCRSCKLMRILQEIITEGNKNGD